MAIGSVSCRAFYDKTREPLRHIRCRVLYIDEGVRLAGYKFNGGGVVLGVGDR